MANEESGQSTVEAPLELSWTVWPAARRPWLSVLIVAFCLGFAYLAWQSLGSRWYAVITLVVLACALAPHFFPTRYELSADGVRVRGFANDRQRAWEHLHSAFGMGDTLIITPHHFVLDEFDPASFRRGMRRLLVRSLAVQLPDGGAEEVRAYVRMHVQTYEWSEIEQWLKTRP